MKTGRFGGQPERSVFSVWVLTGFACCSARKSRSTHAVFRKCSYTCCACSSSNDYLDSNICSCYNWTKRLKSLGTQLIFIGKWRHRRLDYRLAQANEPVKDTQRGKADSLTGTDGSRSALVPLWRELPQITVRLKEGNTIYRFTASFDGMHALPEKTVKLIDSEGSV